MWKVRGSTSSLIISRIAEVIILVLVLLEMTNQTPSSEEPSMTNCLTGIIFSLILFSLTDLHSEPHYSFLI